MTKSDIPPVENLDSDDLVTHANSFLSCIEQRLKELDGEATIGTIKKYNTLKKKVQTLIEQCNNIHPFDEFTKNDNLLFRGLTQEDNLFALRISIDYSIPLQDLEQLMRELRYYLNKPTPLKVNADIFEETKAAFLFELIIIFFAGTTLKITNKKIALGLFLLHFKIGNPILTESEFLKKKRKENLSAQDYKHYLAELVRARLRKFKSIYDVKKLQT
jgi:hypothetical protein